MVKQAWVDSNDRYGTGKTESNPRTGVGQTAANMIRRARRRSNQDMGKQEINRTD